MAAFYSQHLPAFSSLFSSRYGFFEQYLNTLVRVSIFDGDFYYTPHAADWPCARQVATRRRQSLCETEPAGSLRAPEQTSETCEHLTCKQYIAGSERESRSYRPKDVHNGHSVP